LSGGLLTVATAGSVCVTVFDAFVKVTNISRFCAENVVGQSWKSGNELRSVAPLRVGATCTEICRFGPTTPFGTAVHRICSISAI
jgi:hypothetical protein